MARIFIYGNNRYEDPGEAFSIEDVRKHLTQFFPELAQATFSERKIDGGDVEITFAKKVGTKGTTYQGVYPVSGTVTVTVPDWPAWISLDDTWPPTNELVLLRFENGDKVVGALGPANDSRPWMKGVTHWLRLPPDPEAK